MIPQILFTGPLLLGLVYARIAFKSSRVVGALGGFTAMAGLFFLWLPEESSNLADLVGITRGVDLIIYLWMMVSFLAILNLYLKNREQMEIMTKLARHLAILEADLPEQSETADRAD